MRKGFMEPKKGDIIKITPGKSEASFLLAGQTRIVLSVSTIIANHVSSIDHVPSHSWSGLWFDECEVVGEATMLEKVIYGIT